MSTATAQLTLFDIGIDLASLRLVKEDLMDSQRALNTHRAYRHAWKQFDKWATQAGRQTLPASVEATELYIAWMIQQGYRLDTVRAAKHP